MAYFNDSMRVPVAVKGKHKMDLSSQHVTTSDFFQINAVYNRECVPGDDLSVNVETFSRMQPLAAPTFSRCSINNRAFWVPFRAVWRGFNRFITDSPRSTSSGAVVDSSVPTVSNYVLLTSLLGCGSAQDVDRWLSVSTSSDYDVVLNNDFGDLGLAAIPATGTYYLKFTDEGRQVYKVLVSLGYRVQWFIPKNLADTNVMSALPLMSYIKVILDWYFPSAYAGQSLSYSAVDYWLRQDATYAWQAINVERMFDLMTMSNYDADYFVSAWDNPVAPSSGSYSPQNLVDVTSNATGVASGITYNLKVTNDNSDAYPSNSAPSNGTPVLMRIANNATGSSTQFITNFTQYIDTALHRMTDYIRRHQMTSVRPLDRYLSRFGIALSAEKLERSVYLGSDVIDYQIGDVTSTADTATASLGSFAGKGAAYGGKTFDFQTDEYGMFLIVSSIVPHVGYVQGIDRNVMHVAKSDFYTPEYDSLGTQAVSSQELYVSDNGTTSYSSDTTFNGHVFGFLPRYAEYAVGRDRLSGEFIFKSCNAGLDSWYSFRMFDDIEFATPSQVSHSEAFVNGSYDYTQYSRIFQVRDNQENAIHDSFYLIYNFNVGLRTHKLPLWDSYEFEEAGNKEVTTPVGGVKMN